MVLCRLWCNQQPHLANYHSIDYWIASCHTAGLQSPTKAAKVCQVIGRGGRAVANRYPDFLGSRPRFQKMVDSLTLDCLAVVQQCVSIVANTLLACLHTPKTTP